MLLQNGGDINAVDKYKYTALHDAAWEGHVDIVKVLIQNGADVDAVDEDTQMTLHTSSGQGHQDVKVLLQNGADVHAVEREHEQTTLHYAACKDMLTLRKC